MKRSRLRNRRTKPRPPKDFILYARYAEANPCSEFARWLGITYELRCGKYVRLEVGVGYWLDEYQRYKDGRGVSLERHHLWSLARRPDLTSNLIRLTDDEHKWCDGHKPAGRVACLAVKLRKLEHQPQEPDEFTLAEINAAAGKNVIGIVEGYRFADLFFLDLQAEVIAGLEKLAKKEGRSAA